MTSFRVFALPAVWLLTFVPCVCAFGQKLPETGATAPLNLTIGMRAFTSSPGALPDAPSALLAMSDEQTSSSQEPAQVPAQETDEQRKERERLAGEQQVKKQEHQRNFGVIPSFNTVIAGQVPPLTAGQKFDLVYHSIRDPYTFAIAFIVAGFGETSPPAQGYGWGPKGYFYRVGTAYADNIDGAFWGNAILPVILHQDPRYYRKGSGSIKSRILYSALSTVICRGDNGNREFNLSNVAGNMIAGGISNLYYPHAQRGASLIYSNGLTVTAEGAVGAQLLEFGPDLGAMLSRRHQRSLDKKAAAKAANSPATPDN